MAFTPTRDAKWQLQMNKLLEEIWSASREEASILHRIEILEDDHRAKRLKHALKHKDFELTPRPGAPGSNVKDRRMLLGLLLRLTSEA